MGKGKAALVLAAPRAAKKEITINILPFDSLPVKWEPRQRG